MKQKQHKDAEEEQLEDEEEDEEEEEEEEEEKEEVLSQSLRKREKNIQENKAMVINRHNILYEFSIFTKLCDPDI